MGQANSDAFGVGGQGGFTSSTLVTTSASLFVARYDMDTGVAHFWLNPNLGDLVPSDASALNGVLGTSFTAFSFDSIRLGKFASDDATGKGYLDEIRIGTTSEDVGFAASATTGLATFRTTNGLASDGSQDLLTPAGDGVSNLLKFAFNMQGTDPGQAASLDTPNVSVLAPAGSAGLPRLDIESGTGNLQITYIRRKVTGSPPSGITYLVEFSNSLDTASWSVNGAALESAFSIDGTFERVTVTDSVFLSKRFARVKVSSN